MLLRLRQPASLQEPAQHRGRHIIRDHRNGVGSNGAGSVPDRGIDDADAEGERVEVRRNQSRYVCGRDVTPQILASGEPSVSQGLAIDWI